MKCSPLRYNYTQIGFYTASIVTIPQITQVNEATYSFGVCIIATEWVGFNYHKLGIHLKLPCLEGVLILHSPKEARHWGLAKYQKGWGSLLGHGQVSAWKLEAYSTGL